MVTSQADAEDSASEREAFGDCSICLEPIVPAVLEKDATNGSYPNPILGYEHSLAPCGHRFSSSRLILNV